MIPAHQQPGQEDNTPSFGVRLGVSEMIRATEQTAVLMGHLLGYQGVYQTTLRSWAMDCMLNFMHSSCCRMNLVWPTKPELPNADDVKKYGMFKNSGLEGLCLQAVLSPLDGVEAFREGRPGAFSVIAAGEGGSFPEHLNVPLVATPTLTKVKSDKRVRPVPESYFVIALGKSSRQRISKDELFGDVIDKLQSDTPLGSLLDNSEILIRLIAALSDSGRVPSLGMTFEGPVFRHWFPLVNRDGSFRFRQLDGSSVGAALAALFNKVDAAVMVARRTQVLQMSVAAQSLEGCIYALPLRKGKKVKRKKATKENGNKASAEDKASESTQEESKHILTMIVPRESQIQEASDFVLGTHAFLVATSITDVCLMDRVRFDARTVRTETVAISLASKSVRWIRHEFDRTEAWLRTTEGKPVKAPIEIGRVARLARLRE